MTTRIDPKAWLICLKPNPAAQLRLFCFPNAGGGTLAFRAWADRLPADIEVWAAQLPGRESRLREPAFSRVEPLVEALAAALAPYVAQPFALFGHSMGALIAFELTRALRRQQRSPVHLFVSARQAPQLPPVEPVIYQLPDDRFVEQLRRLNGTPEAVLQNRELMQLLLPLLRADFAVNEAYRYVEDAPLAIPISAFGGLEDHRAQADGISAWAAQTSSAFRWRMLPGDHFFINSSQSLLFQAICEDLALPLPPDPNRQQLPQAAR